MAGKVGIEPTVVVLETTGLPLTNFPIGIQQPPMISSDTVFLGAPQPQILKLPQPYVGPYVQSNFWVKP